MKTVLIALCIVFFPLLALVIGRHLWLQNSPQQELFLSGMLPPTLPDGEYHGELAIQAQWQGKRFDAQTATGVNLFRDGINVMQEEYPFVMDVGPSVIDDNFQVITIDYDLLENPWWMRLIVDEMVETEPNVYLGKVHLRIVPGFPVAVGFFELRQIKERY